mgnify:CR=1 FL=1
MGEHDDAAKVRFFPPGIPLLAILGGWLLQRILPLSLPFLPDPPLRYLLGGTIAVGAVLLLGAWPVLLFRRHGQSANPWKPTPRLEEGGAYRFTRNPMYLQMVLVCVGVAVALANGWILLLVPVVGWALKRLAIEPEEAYLEGRFGQAYLDYKRRVRRWL